MSDITPLTKTLIGPPLMPDGTTTTIEVLDQLVYEAASTGGKGPVVLLYPPEKYTL